APGLNEAVTDNSMRSLRDSRSGTNRRCWGLFRAVRNFLLSVRFNHELAMKTPLLSKGHVGRRPQRGDAKHSAATRLGRFARTQSAERRARNTFCFGPHSPQKWSSMFGSGETCFPGT